MNKVVEYLLRAVVTLIVSSGSYELFSRRWFGAAIFDSYSNQKNLAQLGGVSDDLYRVWGSTSVQTCLSHISPGSIILGVLLLLGLLAHVVFKPYVAPALSTPQSNVRKAPRFRLLYLRAYHFVTVMILLCLLCVYFFAPVRHGLLLVFLFIAIPSSIYVLLYSRDLRDGGYTERFVLICLLLFLIVGLIEWPALYGRRVFNPEFSTAVFVRDIKGDCDEKQLGRGPVFLAFQSANRAQNLFLRLCLGKDGRKYLDFFQAPDDYSLAGKINLSDVIKTSVAPVSGEDGASAVADAEKKLEKLRELNAQP